MKALSAPSSAITLADAVGLIKDLMDKLTGKRADFWLRSFKRFLRKENPWPPVRILFSDKWRSLLNVYLGKALATAFEEAHFKADLKDINLELSPEYDALAKEFGTEGDLRYSVVAIRVADLLSPNERANMTYRDMLEKAKTLGFFPCDVFSGLTGLVSLIGDQRHSIEGPIRFVICSHPFVDENKVTQRLYQGIVFPGENPNYRGSMCLQTIGSTVDWSLRFESDPSYLMIFISVNE